MSNKTLGCLFWVREVSSSLGSYEDWHCSWEMFLHIHYCIRNTSKWRKTFPFPHPCPQIHHLARTGCLLRHDFAGPAHITADSSGLGTECSCCCFIGMRAWACPSAEQGWLWLCAGYHALYQTGAVSKFIHFPGWLCATSYPKWYHCILQLSLKCW